MANLMSSREVAEMLGVTDQCVRTWRSQRRGPSYYKIEGGRIRYKREEVEKWLSKQENNDGAETDND